MYSTARGSTCQATIHRCVAQNAIEWQNYLLYGLSGPSSALASVVATCLTAYTMTSRGSALRFFGALRIMNSTL